MPLSKFVDSLYGELSLVSSKGDAGIDGDALKQKSFETRARIQTARTLVAKFPSQVERVLNGPYVKNGYEVIGYGFHSTVLKLGDEAVKIMRRSVDKSEDWRLSMIDTLRTRQDIALGFMGTYAIAQTFAIEPHPVLRHKDVIIARQPFVSFDIPALGLFQSHTHTGEDEQLRDFAMAGLNMYDAHQLVPDILGENNIVMKDKSLLLLDSTPMSQLDNSAGFNKTVELLSALADRNTRNDQ